MPRLKLLELFCSIIETVQAVLQKCKVVISALSSLLLHRRNSSRKTWCKLAFVACLVICQNVVQGATASMTDEWPKSVGGVGDNRNALRVKNCFTPPMGIQICELSGYDRPELINSFTFAVDSFAQSAELERNKGHKDGDRKQPDRVRWHATPISILRIVHLLFGSIIGFCYLYFWPNRIFPWHRWT